MVPLEGSTALGTKNLKKISPTPFNKKNPGAMKHHHPSQGFFKRYIFRGHNFEKFEGSLAIFPIYSSPPRTTLCFHRRESIQELVLFPLKEKKKDRAATSVLTLIFK
jgi:hypothetical protein